MWQIILIHTRSVKCTEANRRQIAAVDINKKVYNDHSAVCLYSVLHNCSTVQLLIQQLSVQSSGSTCQCLSLQLSNQQTRDMPAHS